LIVLTLIGVSSRATAADPNSATAPWAKARLGINLAGPADWNTELPFVDVVRMSRPWVSQRTGAAWGTGPALALDEFGWVKRLEPDCFAESPLCTIKGGHYPSGVYTVLYEGDGAIAFRGGVKVLDERPGRMRIDVDASQGGFMLQIRRTEPENYIRNIHVIMPGFEATWQRDPFHPAFLERWRGMACFRFMDWMDTNNSEVRTWAQRPTLRHATFSKRGVALEWMIDLCNRQHIDPWFCMPHMADDDFIRRFATMVRERLDPALNVYVEYSNEVWNSQFAQTHYAQEKGRALGLGVQPWEAGWHYTAQRSLEIFTLWEEVLGGRQRLVRVLPSQSGNTGVSEGVLGFRGAAQHADVLAVAPYMPFTVGRGKLKDMGAEMVSWDVEKLLDFFEEHAFTDSMERIRKDKGVADKYGVGLVAYEGGQHMVAMLRDQDLVERLSALMHEANRHPRMGALYTRYFDEWARIGGGVFAVFASIGGYNNFGAWGLAEFYDSKPADSPKLDATYRWASRHGQAVVLENR
jgi:hypothetical protein